MPTAANLTEKVRKIAGRRHLLLCGPEDLMATLEPIDDLNFDTEVLGSNVPFLLDFSATWCAPCKALQPILEALLAEHGGRLRIGKIDLDASPGVAAKLGVRGAPTLVLFSSGREQARKLGFTGRQALLGWLADASSASGVRSDRGLQHPM